MALAANGGGRAAHGLGLSVLLELVQPATELVSFQSLSAIYTHLIPSQREGSENPQTEPVGGRRTHLRQNRWGAGEPTGSLHLFSLSNRGEAAHTWVSTMTNDSHMQVLTLAATFLSCTEKGDAHLSQPSVLSPVEAQSLARYVIQSGPIRSRLLLSAFKVCGLV